MDNPFSLPDNDPELYHQREVQRFLEFEQKQKFIEAHIEGKYVPPQSILKEIRDIEPAQTLLALPPTGVHSLIGLPRAPAKKESIREFIQRKREILLVKRSIQNKKNRSEVLEQKIHEYYDEDKNNNKALEDQIAIYKKYEEKLNDDVVKLELRAKIRQEEKSRKQEQSNELLRNIEALKSKCDSGYEEREKLEKCKSFVEELFPPGHPDSAHFAQHAAFFVTEDTQDYSGLTLQFLERVNALEHENLQLIEKSQEDEQELEQQKVLNKSELRKLEKQETETQKVLKSLKEERQSLLFKIRELRAGEDTTDRSEEQKFGKLRTELQTLFEAIKGDMSDNPSNIRMLEVIEDKLEAFFRKQKEISNPQIYREKQDEVEKERRGKRREEKNVVKRKLTEEGAREKERRKLNVVKRGGRPPMNRIWPEEKVVKPKSDEEPHGVRDWKEFIDENVPDWAKLGS